MPRRLKNITEHSWVLKGLTMHMLVEKKQEAIDRPALAAPGQQNPLGSRTMGASTSRSQTLLRCLGVSATTKDDRQRIGKSGNGKMLTWVVRTTKI